MNEIRDILIGIDFGKKESQIAYYDRKAKEPLSVSMKMGTSQFEFPTCICKRLDRGDWCFGREAEYFAKEHGAFLVEGLYEICGGTKSISIGDEEKEPWELIGIFLEKALRTLGTIEPVKNTKCLVITVEELGETMVQNLQKACEHIGFSKTHYILQDYQESFFYYAASQKPDYWSRNVAWYDFTPRQVTFRGMRVGMGTRPVLVTHGKPKMAALSGEANIRDLEFYQFISQTMGTDVYSSVYITGRGFHQEWASKSIALLCRQGRKAFYGTNLFAKGACYTAKEKLEDKKLKGYLYVGSALVQMNIGMEMMVMGSPAYCSLIDAGKNWYESSGKCELILDDNEALVFVLSNMLTGEKKKVSMALPGLPVRPNRTTRLLLSLKYLSPGECKINVHDLGFGDMFPSGKRVWTETVRCQTVQNELPAAPRAHGRSSTSGYILCQIKRAEIPYYIESISMNIYSIEELCYFFYKNPELLDTGILNETLCNWIREELGLEGLYKKLYEAATEDVFSVGEFVYPVFKEINYLSFEERKKYDRRLTEIQEASAQIRLKMKGDCLAENGIYVNALKVYQGLIEGIKEKKEPDAVFFGNVYHNAGCVYSYLFQKQEALECFEKSYELLHTGNSLRSYLFAYYNARTPLEYFSKLSELGVDEQTKKEVQKSIDEIMNGDQPPVPEHRIDSMLENMIEEYHRSTGS